MVCFFTEMTGFPPRPPTRSPGMGLVPKRLPSSEMGGLGEPRQGLLENMSRVIHSTIFGYDQYKRGQFKARYQRIRRIDEETAVTLIRNQHRSEHTTHASTHPSHCTKVTRNP
jgi:hypothetical protein